MAEAYRRGYIQMNICYQCLKNQKIRLIGQIAGWDMLRSPINTDVGSDSNVSDTKFAVENAL
jgi:hypothetical protein